TVPGGFELAVGGRGLRSRRVRGPHQLREADNDHHQEYRPGRLQFTLKHGLQRSFSSGDQMRKNHDNGLSDLLPLSWEALSHVARPFSRALEPDAARAREICRNCVAMRIGVG